MTTAPLLRLRDDGSVPPDNPFVGRSDALPEIWSWGHRNVQGAAIHPATGDLWATEHGPQGGDELNLVQPGRNHGWPVITYGRNYGIGTKIGDGTERADVVAPLAHWVPTSIAPSGMAFLTSDRYPGWKGNLFIGALRGQGGDVDGGLNGLDQIICVETSIAIELAAGHHTGKGADRIHQNQVAQIVAGQAQTGLMGARRERKGDDTAGHHAGRVQCLTG